MTESIYKEYENKYYNPNDNDKRPGDNDNWKSIQKGFHRVGSTQLETSAGLTLGKGTEDETSVTAGELEEIKNPTQLETSGGLTLGKGTVDEVSVTAAELSNAIESTDIARSDSIGVITITLNNTNSGYAVYTLTNEERTALYNKFREMFDAGYRIASVGLSSGGGGSSPAGYIIGGCFISESGIQQSTTLNTTTPAKIGVSLICATNASMTINVSLYVDFRVKE